LAPPLDAGGVGTLLAVDLGLRTGLAVYGREGQLLRYRSTHFPTVAALKRALPRVLDEAPGLVWLVCEGDRHYADIWSRLAEKRGARVLRPSPEAWRRALFAPGARCDAAQAKASASRLARQVIEVCGGRRPTSLTHDVAEAILIGLWGLRDVGWIAELPVGLRWHGPEPDGG